MIYATPLEGRVILIGELSIQSLDIFFAQFFDLPDFLVFFFPNKCVKFNELAFLVLGEFHGW